MNHPRRDPSTPARRPRRTATFAAGMLVGLAALAGCGDDDDEPSAQEQYCQAGEEVESSVTALADLNLIAEGTNGLESAIGAVREDVNTLVETASEAAAEETAAMEESLEGLESAIQGLAGEITADNVSALATAVQDVVTAAQAVYGTLSDCP